MDQLRSVLGAGSRAGSDLAGAVSVAVPVAVAVAVAVPVADLAVTVAVGVVVVVGPLVSADDRMLPSLLTTAGVALARSSLGSSCAQVSVASGPAASIASPTGVEKSSTSEHAGSTHASAMDAPIALAEQPRSMARTVAFGRHIRQRLCLGSSP